MARSSPIPSEGPAGTDSTRIRQQARRRLLRYAAAGSAGSLLPAGTAWSKQAEDSQGAKPALLPSDAIDRNTRPGTRIELPFENGARELMSFPQKRPLILLTQRPPQLETPFYVYNEGIITPNDAFFVRYHWSDIPTEIDPRTYRLEIGGHVERPLRLSLTELKQMAEPIEVVAVHQCSGNSRGHSNPRVGGGQVSHGLMGNGRWQGVALRTVLEKAGVKAGAVQVSFDGMDAPPVGPGPDFIKALPIDQALDGEVMLAWSLNDADLPWLNGYPLRLVVPGHYGTYWIKHLSNIQVLDKAFDGFWMAKAYRLPDNDCGCVEPGAKPDRTVPIARFSVRSFLTSHVDAARIPASQTTVLRGIAFDGGSGIRNVMVSTDGGKRWQEAKLGKDLGRYSFREWTLPFRPGKTGEYRVMVKATSRDGDTQPETFRWNPAGYRYNPVETTRLVAV